MGCFLGCFGSSKDRKRRKQRHKVQPRGEQRNVGYVPVQSAASLVLNNPEKPTTSSSVSQVRDIPEKQLFSSSARKKVSFNSNVVTYEHISAEESTEFSAEKGERNEEIVKEKKSLSKPSQSQSNSSDDSSITSTSSGSYPSNHRYQNCRDSDDELDYGESDIEANDDDDDDDEYEEDDDDGVLDYEDDEILESRSKVSTLPFTEEVDSPAVKNSLPEREVKPNPNARDRSVYVHSVLNPVENLTQWKAVKAKGTPPLKQQKENFTHGQEQRNSFSSELSFKELSFSFKPKQPDHQSKKSNQEIAVDASLSNWLGSSESTPVRKTITTPEKEVSYGSNSPKSFEDRPILGALTLEELKQFSASCSPRRSRSPSRSPDEMPIIGTVGTYWNNSGGGSGKDSGSVSSFKGIPNTTSKYREDKKVNWHSTPFETRLERALAANDHGL